MTTEDLRDVASGLGFSDLGVCSALNKPHADFYRRWLDRGYAGEMEYLTRHSEMKSNVKNFLPKCQSVIAVALDYNQPNNPTPDEPKIAKYALGRDYHKVIKSKLNALAQSISLEHPGAVFKVCVDSAPVFEREFAQLAGLGWFGKNTCLINSSRGSWFFLAVLLTSIEFEPDSPAMGGCGTCRECIDACPTGAIVFCDDRWQVDARNCISYLTIEKRTPIEPELEDKLAGWTFGCDICQEVCPFNQVRSTQPARGAMSTEPDFLTPKKWPSLVQLANISYVDWDALTQGSPVRRAGWVGIKRNAKLNLERTCGRHLDDTDKVS